MHKSIIINNHDYRPYMINQILLSNRCRAQIIATPEQALNNPAHGRIVRQYLAVAYRHTRAGTERNIRHSRILYRCGSRLVAAPYCGLKSIVVVVSDQSYMVYIYQVIKMDDAFSCMNRCSVRKPHSKSTFRGKGCFYLLGSYIIRN